ncbi:MAG: magnesium transporter CorA family protein [Stagnimonas sp.]|nr:magnesium transporter CorA family protein [Stagnimonas sp.]
MQTFLFSRQGEIPKRLDGAESLPEEGFLWLDFTRYEAQSWPKKVEKLTGIKVHEDHVIDSFNGDHPSFYDGTEDYDMVIFQGLTPEDCESTHNLIVTKSAAFFLFDHLLVSVHASENVSFDVVKRKFCEAKLRFPSTPFGLVHVILDTMADRYSTIVDELETRLDHLQDMLLDPKNPFEDWRELLHQRKQAHQLELLCEQNQVALDTWKREMRGELSDSQRVRLNDLSEHLQRLMHHGDAIQKDIEVAMQLHFAAVSHKTNKVVQTLTVLSAIFFPLTLITGIYGMNFQHMPELEWHYGYYGLLAVLVLVGGGLLIYFKRRGFF